MAVLFASVAVTLTLAVAVIVSVPPAGQLFEKLPPETTTWQPELGMVVVVVAVIVAVPTETPVTKPPGELTVATVVSELDQLTLSPLISLWLPSEYMPCAASWAVLLVAIMVTGGLMYIELREGLMKKPQAAMNADTNRAAATVITSRSRTRAGRGSPGPEENSPRLPSEELPAP